MTRLDFPYEKLEGFMPAYNLFSGTCQVIFVPPNQRMPRMRLFTQKHEY
jgi:hypothetical protein